MKAFFSLLVVLIILFILFANWKESPSPGTPATPAPAAQNAEQAPAGQTPVATPAGSAADAAIPRIQSVAQQTQVTLTSIQPSGNQINVTVEWMGDQASIGGDFVEKLLREGIIRDFEDLPEGSKRWADQDLRSHFAQSFVLKLK